MHNIAEYHRLKFLIEVILILFAFALVLRDDLVKTVT